MVSVSVGFYTKYIGRFVTFFHAIME